MGHTVRHLEPLRWRTAIYSTVCPGAGGSIQLVDYDGIGAGLKGRNATEIGTCYQHPERTSKTTAKRFDRFSALVIYLSLAALERMHLWNVSYRADNLIFVAKISTSESMAICNNYSYRIGQIDQPPLPWRPSDEALTSPVCRFFPDRWPARTAPHTAGRRRRPAAVRRQLVDQPPQRLGTSVKFDHEPRAGAASSHPRPSGAPAAETGAGARSATSGQPSAVVARACISSGRRNSLTER